MIKIDVDNLMVDKSELDSAKNEFDELVNKMQGIIDRISENWEGQSAQAFGEQFSEVRAGALTQVSELLQTISTQVQQVCDNAEDFDGDIASQIK